MHPASIVRACAVALAGVLLVSGCGGGSDGGNTVAPPAGGPSLRDPTAYSSDPNASLPSGNEAAAITTHTLALNGRMLAYTASAGH